MATYTSNYGWAKPSGSDNVDISVLNDNLDDQDSTIHDAFLNMAPPFSESSTYAVDDIVLYGTGLYKCHTAVVTPGSWTGSTNWQVYKLSEGGSGGGGTSDYTDLSNKPSINNVTLSGNKTTSDLGLQEELTFDNVPTDGSNNPVKSDGIYDSEKDIYAVMGQMGAKNLIPYPYRQASGTVNRGITFTYDNRGVVTANNTSSATDQPYLVLNHLYFLEKNKEFIISSRSSTLFCVIYFYNASGQTVNVTKTIIYDDGTEYTTTNSYISLFNYTIHQWCKFKVTDGDFAFVAVQVRAQSGSITYNNEKIYPMLRLASDTDDTYQPYAKTNRELTDEIATKTKNFQGTIAEWNQLTTAEKKAYDHASITGTGGGEYNVDKTTGGLNPTAGMPETYPAEQVMMSDGVTSVEDAVDELTSGLTNVENKINKLITTSLIYSGTDGYFQIPQGTPGPHASQVSVVARNIANGAIYALWYDASVVCFRVGSVISGDAPSDGNMVYVQYSAIPI